MISNGGERRSVISLKSNVVELFDRSVAIYGVLNFYHLDISKQDHSIFP